MLKRRIFTMQAMMMATAIAVFSASGGGAKTPAGDDSATVKSRSVSSSTFDEAADNALQAMTKRAEELGIHGVAVVAFFESDSIRSWSSKMAVVGTMKNAPSKDNRGDNLLAIAYTKASEMAETLKASGTADRPPMTGEFGWQGGLIAKSKTGYWIAAFSGGPSEEDVKVSRAGLEKLDGK
jgi:hypothetical protein